MDIPTPVHVCEACGHPYPGALAFQFMKDGCLFNGCPSNRIAKIGGVDGGK